MMVDVDELLAEIDRDAKVLKNEYAPVRLVADIFKSVIKTVADASGYEMPEWISVKDDLPEEHPSMFAAFYDTDKWNRAMWRTESDRVLVTIRFPDGTRTVDKGKLQDGEWRTGVSQALCQEVTHWAVWPEPPKEES